MSCLLRDRSRLKPCIHTVVVLHTYNGVAKMRVRVTPRVRVRMRVGVGVGVRVGVRVSLRTG